MMTKKQCQEHIAEYSKRREKLKQETSRRLKRMASRIKQYKRTIQIIEHREGEIRKVAEKVCEFFNYIPLRNNHPLRNCIEDTSSKMVLMRKIFYKYGIENGLKGSHLADWVGATNRSLPYNRRREFTKSFQYNSENKRIWDHFNLFIKNNDYICSGGSELMEAA